MCLYQELAKLIEEIDSPQMMAYKLLYTTEHVSSEDIATVYWEIFEVK